MKRICSLLLTVPFALQISGQRIENVPFGDFEHWSVRYVKESSIIGGETKEIHMIAPTDTIYGSKSFDYSKTIWASSNTVAEIMGVVKASATVWPDKGPSGTCAKLATKLVSLKAAGLINIKVLAGGSIYWGNVQEPIDGTKNPFSHMDWGISFTGRPSAWLLDYRAVIPNTGKLTKANALRAVQIDGYDPESAWLILQNRWEDAEGNIHARRVGSAFLRIEKSTDGWVRNMRIPMIYGDARKDPEFKSYMGLLQGDRQLYAFNSKGEKVPILEEEWAEADSKVTHAIMSITTGSQDAFVGAVDNVLWVDNIRLEYPE